MRFLYWTIVGGLLTAAISESSFAAKPKITFDTRRIFIRSITSDVPFTLKDENSGESFSSDGAHKFEFRRSYEDLPARFTSRNKYTLTFGTQEKDTLELSETNRSCKRVDIKQVLKEAWTQKNTTEINRAKHDPHYLKIRLTQTDKQPICFQQCIIGEPYTYSDDEDRFHTDFIYPVVIAWEKNNFKINGLSPQQVPCLEK